MLVAVGLLVATACDATSGEATVPARVSSATATEIATATAAVAVEATGVAPTSEVAAAGLPFEQHAEYREYGAPELAAAGFVDTGRFLRVPFNPYPAAESSYRAGFTAVRVATDGFISFDGESSAWSAGFPPGRGWSGGNAIGLKTTVDGQELYLTFSGEWGISGGNPMTTILGTGAAGAAFYSKVVHGRPVVMVSVADVDGGRYPAVVDTFGHLWVRMAPIIEAPVANDTGELFGVGSAERLGPLPGAVGNWQNLTWCDGGKCLAVVHTHDRAGLPAPLDGTATCQGGEETVIELDSGRYRLVFEAALAFGSSAARCGDGFPREVMEGELLSRHPSWEVTAFGRTVSSSTWWRTGNGCSTSARTSR